MNRKEVLDRYRVQLTVLFALAIGMAFSSVAAQEPTYGKFYMLQTDSLGLNKNTLIEEVSRSDGKVSLAVYQFDLKLAKATNDQSRERNKSRDASASIQDFDAALKDSISVTREGNQLVFNHPSKTRADGSAVVERINLPADRCITPALGTQPDTKEEIDQTLKQIESKNPQPPAPVPTPTPTPTPTPVDPVSMDNEMARRIQIRDAIEVQLNEDFKEVFLPTMSPFVKELNDLDRRMNAELKGKSAADQKKIQAKYRTSKRWVKQRAIKTLLVNLKNDPQGRFKGAAGEARASRLFTALTLRGEFGGDPDHSTLPHYFWAMVSIDKRVSSRFHDDMDETLRHGLKLDNFLEHGRAAVVLSDEQYQAWRLTDGVSEQIIRSTQNSTMKDIFEFMGAYDAGLITTKDGSKIPELMFYVSPFAMSYIEDDYPSWWYKDTQAIYVSSKSTTKQLTRNDWFKFWPSDRNGAERKKVKNPPPIYILPKIVRIDQKSEGKSGLKSDPQGKFDEEVDPLHFEGATRK